MLQRRVCCILNLRSLRSRCPPGIWGAPLHKSQASRAAELFPGAAAPEAEVASQPVIRPAHPGHCTAELTDPGPS